MCELSNLTPSELNAITKAQLITAALKDVRRSEIALESDASGNAIRMDETITDAYGELIGIREMVWTYYKTGEVNVITVREFDAAHKLTGGHMVKHFTDGKQPILTVIEPGKR